MSGPATKIRMEFGARADTWDFRDALYRPNLIEVPESVPPARFLSFNVPILHQGPAAACTGFSLATVANYLLRSRARDTDSLPEDVSPEMLYAMARRYDEYPGTSRAGSSIRGALKGWHRHGVCSRRVWENEELDGARYGDLGVLTRARAKDASNRPLGAYYRVDSKDLNALHCALTEVGVLVAALNTHDGWFDLFHPIPAGEEMDPILASLLDVAATKRPMPAIGYTGAAQRGVDPTLGLIPWPAPDSLQAGLHAVAVIGYDREGFWIQNSQGTRWGRGGLARISYDDWMENASDAWVARLGAPVTLGPSRSRGSMGVNRSIARDYAEMRPHLVTIGVDGRLQEHGTFATSPSDIRSILRDEFRVQTETWGRRRLLLIASSGIQPLDATIRAIASIRDRFLEAEVYPLLILWNLGFAERMVDALQRAWQARQPAGQDARAFVERAGPVMDSALEALCRRLGGWVEWDHVKRTAARTVEPGGGVAVLLDQLNAAFRDASLEKWPFEVHVVGESSAALLLGHLVRRLTSPKAEGGMDHPVVSATLCGAACTTDFFKANFLAPIRDGAIRRTTLVNLDDAAEKVDGFGGIYRGSLLYLLSNAMEDEQRVPPAETGTEMLGLARHVVADPELTALFAPSLTDAPDAPKVEHVILPRSSFEGGGQLHGRILHGFGHISSLLARVLDIPDTDAEPTAADLAELLAPSDETPSGPTGGFL
jgi:hypothetical protein